MTIGTVAPDTLREKAEAVTVSASLLVEAISEAVKEAARIKQLQTVMAAFFRRQGEALDLSVLKPYFDGELKEAAGDAIGEAFREVVEATTPQAETAIARMAVDGAQFTYIQRASEYGVSASFELPQPRAVRWANKHAAEQVKKINKTTEARIRNMVTSGLRDGDSYGTVARNIKTRFKEFAVGQPQHHIKSRAELVAVTENSFSMEGGNRMLVDDMVATGLTMEKQRAGPDDEHTSDACLEDMAAGWIPEDQAFPSGIHEGPEHPGCRHNTQYRVAR